jgi:hypothetical protein
MKALDYQMPAAVHFRQADGERRTTLANDSPSCRNTIRGKLNRPAGNTWTFAAGRLVNTFGAGTLSMQRGNRE